MKKRAFVLLAATVMALTALSAAVYAAVDDSVQTYLTKPLGNAVYTDVKAYIGGHGILSYSFSDLTVVMVDELKNYGFAETITEDGKEIDITRINGASPEREDVVGLPKGRKVGEKFSNVYNTVVEVRLDGVPVAAYKAGSSTLIRLDDVAKAYSESYVWDSGKRELRLELSGTVNSEWLERQTKPEMSSENARIASIITRDGEYDKSDKLYILPVYNKTGDDYALLTLTFSAEENAVKAAAAGGSSASHTSYTINFDLTPDGSGKCGISAELVKSGGKAEIQAKAAYDSLISGELPDISYLHQTGDTDVIAELDSILPARLSVIMALISGLE